MCGDKQYGEMMVERRMKDGTISAGSRAKDRDWEGQ